MPNKTGTSFSTPCYNCIQNFIQVEKFARKQAHRCLLFHTSVTLNEDQDYSHWEQATDYNGVCCCLLVAQRPSDMLVYIRDRSAQTIVHAVTLR